MHLMSGKRDKKMIPSPVVQLSWPCGAVELVCLDELDLGLVGRFDKPETRPGWALGWLGSSRPLMGRGGGARQSFCRLSLPTASSSAAASGTVCSAPAILASPAASVGGDGGATAGACDARPVQTGARKWEEDQSLNGSNDR